MDSLGLGNAKADRAGVIFKRDLFRSLLLKNWQHVHLIEVCLFGRLCIPYLEFCCD